MASRKAKALVKRLNIKCGLLSDFIDRGLKQPSIDQVLNLMEKTSNDMVTLNKLFEELNNEQEEDANKEI